MKTFKNVFIKTFKSKIDIDALFPIFITETFLLLSFLLTIPVTILVIEMFFSYGTFYIPDELLQKMV